MFSPSLGKVMVGSVVKRSAGHIGCLLHNTFNISMRAGKDEIAVVEGDMVKIEVRISLNGPKAQVARKWGRSPHIDKQNTNNVPIMNLYIFTCR